MTVNNIEKNWKNDLEKVASALPFLACLGFTIYLQIVGYNTQSAFDLKINAEYPYPLNHEEDLNKLFKRLRTQNFKTWISITGAVITGLYYYTFKDTSKDTRAGEFSSESHAKKLNQLIAQKTSRNIVKIDNGFANTALDLLLTKDFGMLDGNEETVYLFNVINDFLEKQIKTINRELESIENKNDKKEYLKNSTMLYYITNIVRNLHKPGMQSSITKIVTNREYLEKVINDRNKSGAGKYGYVIDINDSMEIMQLQKQGISRFYNIVLESTPYQKDGLNHADEINKLLSLNNKFNSDFPKDLIAY